jgi:hypothetical protein
MVSSTAKNIALSLNLFQNFKSDFRHFTTFEMVYTYLYIAGFIAMSAAFGVQFFKSTHLSFQCGVSPEYETVCPSEFVICTCRHTPGMLSHVCGAGHVDLSTCTCCYYGDIQLENGIWLYLTHLGGFWTFSIGVSMVLLAMYRYFKNKEIDKKEKHAPNKVETMGAGFVIEEEKEEKEFDIQLCRVRDVLGDGNLPFHYPLSPPHKN